MHENKAKWLSPRRRQQHVKNLASEPKTTRLHPTCFKIIAMHSLCYSSLPVWRISFLRKGPPSCDLFYPALDPPLGGYGWNTLTYVRSNEHFFTTKFRKHPLRGSVVICVPIQIHALVQPPSFNNTSKIWLPNGTNNNNTSPHMLLDHCSLVVWRRKKKFFKGPHNIFLPCPRSAPWQIWPQHLKACALPWALHPYQVS